MSHHPPEAVLEHLDWVRALAQRLCSDAAQAEDVSQEAALVAMRRPPRSDHSLRQWLAGVVRNLVRRERRGAVRRLAREEEVARGDRVPSTVELLEKVSVERRVVEAVLALREPYRTTILLRYFEGLTPQAIARRTDTATATVKTRLRRALAQLRETLNDDFGGDGRSWLLALIPLVPTRGPLAAAALTGALAVNAKIVLLPAAVAVLAGGFWWQARSIDAPRPIADASELSKPNLEPVRESLVPGESSSRTPVEATVVAGEPITEAPTVSQENVAIARTSAVVIDLDDRPVVGVGVQLFDSDEVLLMVQDSDEWGAVFFETTSQHGRMTIQDEHYAAVMEAHISGGSWGDVEHTLIVSPNRRVEGIVLDEQGRPIAGAKLVYGTSVDLRTRSEVILSRSKLLTWEARSDVDGSFAFEEAPELHEASLRATKFGHSPANVGVATRGPQRVEVVLQSIVPSEDTVFGLVRNERGDPVEGAYVSLGYQSVRSDSEGQFQLEVAEESGRRLIAARAGTLPAMYELSEGEPWPKYVELVLGGAPLSIAGRVVDANGRAVSGAKISLKDATDFGWVPLDAAGGDIVVQARVEAILAGNHLSPKFEADSDGRFEVRGLLDRAYTLLVINPWTLAVAESDPVTPGGGDIEVVVADEGRIGALTGRLVTVSGEPLGGVRVSPRRFLEGNEVYPVVQGEDTITAEDGTFRFESLNLDNLRLGLWGGPILSRQRHLFEDGFDPVDVEIVVRQQCHFLVDLGDDPERASAFKLLDENGVPMRMSWSDGTMSITYELGRLNGGRSQVLTASEGGATLVLEDAEGVEVLRLQVFLKADGINRIDV